MALTLAISDNAAGTGVTATISGGDTGVTYSLFRQAANATTWTAAGTRSGNGTISDAASNGYYWWYASGLVSSVAAVSNLVKGVATASTQSTQERIMAAVESEIHDMCGVSLVGIATTRVYVMIAPDRDAVQYPCIILTHQSAESLRPATNLRDDVTRPIVVMVCDRNHQVYTANVGTYLLWRQNLIRKFTNARLNGVTESMICTVEPAPIFDPNLPAYQHMVSAFTLRFRCRESRGV